MTIRLPRRPRRAPTTRPAGGPHTPAPDTRAVRARLRRAATLAIAALAALASHAASAAARAPASLRVVSGSTINSQQFPYVAAIESGADFVCGGSLIAPDRVLTAAHCVVDLRVGDRVVVGGSQRRRIAHIAQDPRWTARVDAGAAPTDVLPYDVAILALSAPITRIAPIRLAGDADRALYAPGAPLLLAGMGSTNRDGYGYGVLRYAFLQARSDRACSALLRPLHTARLFVGSAMLCTTDPDDAPPYRAACHGDSGAPLTASAPDNARVQVGVVDWSTACGFAHNDPAAFVEVPAIVGFALTPTPAYRPEPLARPSLTGTPRVGHTVRCRTPRYADPQPDVVKHGFFLRTGYGNDMIARGKTYTIPPRLRGRLLTCAVLAHSPGGEVVSAAPRPRRVKPRATTAR